MKLSVRVRGEWFAVPCKGTENLSWLGQDALRRYTKLQPKSTFTPRNESVFEIRKTRGGAILDPDDVIKSVLNDDDFVSVVLESDKASPLTGPVEVPFIPEQIANTNHSAPECWISVDGNSMSTDDLTRLASGTIKIKLTADAADNVGKARKLVDEILAEHKVVYGITTGFGKFARTTISHEKLEELQDNLIRSHAAGVGPPLSPPKTRELLALRINVLAKGYSGISLKTLNQYIDAFNESCLPWIPEQGSVGASGDLAPMAHLALGMMGEGKMWSPQSGWGEARYVLEAHGLQPIRLGAKEGLALINGTQLITAIGSEALERARNCAHSADIIGALTLDVLMGSTKAFDTDIHAARPHRGQIQVARRFRSLLHSDTYPSEIALSHIGCDKVQDAYTIRCCPQVHGIVNDTIEFVHGILTVEINSATDNPMVFSERGEIISGGNFHGEYPAKALDYLAIAVHELSSISERRIERMCNPNYSELPAFLVQDGGLNSGFMIAHCTAAALVSENKVLCHPSSVDSISTSAGTEDHVSMGPYAARKALRVVENVERVLAIELLAACQALEFRRPLKTTLPLEKVYEIVRSVVAPWIKDRYMAPDIDAATDIIRDGTLWRLIKPYMDNYHTEQAVETRVMSPTAYKRRRLLSKSKSGSPPGSRNCSK